MEQTIQIHLFYPLLFFTLVFLGTLITIVIVKCKDSTLFNNIFNKHTDEHIDTTDKLSKAHTEVVEAKWDNAHEKEMHDIEDKLRSIEKQMQEISSMLTDITNRVIELEKRK
jgi:DNA-binding transcriptional regulator GbsR (MarR family)